MKSQMRISIGARILLAQLKSCPKRIGDSNGAIIDEAVAFVKKFEDQTGYSVDWLRLFLLDKELNEQLHETPDELKKIYSTQFNLKEQTLETLALFRQQSSNQISELVRGGLYKAVLCRLCLRALDLHDNGEEASIPLFSVQR